MDAGKEVGFVAETAMGSAVVSAGPCGSAVAAEPAAAVVGIVDAGAEAVVAVAVDIEVAVAVGLGVRIAFGFEVGAPVAAHPTKWRPLLWSRLLLAGEYSAFGADCLAEPCSVAASGECGCPRTVSIPGQGPAEGETGCFLGSSGHVPVPASEPSQERAPCRANGRWKAQPDARRTCPAEPRAR